MTPEDERIARLSRALRRKAGVRQADLLTSRFAAQAIEAGRAGHLRLEVVRAHFAGLGAKAQLDVRWNGAALDRLLDARHAAVVDGTAQVLHSYTFLTKTEYSFNVFGERGSIDIFGAHEACQAVFVGEAKSEWGSLEETLRRQDMKVRLAPTLCQEAFGWRPTSIASVLIFPNERTNRRVAERYAAALSGYAARGREVRAWLGKPSGPLAGIWFLSNA